MPDPNNSHKALMRAHANATEWTEKAAKFEAAGQLRKATDAKKKAAEYLRQAKSIGHMGKQPRSFG